MSDKPDAELLQSVWTEARDLVKKLEGSTVQRFAVKAGDYEIEIERGMPTSAPAPAIEVDGAQQGAPPLAAGAGPGPGVAPEARAASGVFSAIGAPEADNRVPVLAPLVGTFYRAASPDAKAFCEIGDVVEPGQVVCIVEAMKLMNEVVATEKGRVDEIVVDNGDWVEFDQVLMHLEPVE